MNNFWQDEPEIQQALVQITSMIRAAVLPASPYIRPILLDLADNRGKMLRPAMIYIASLINIAEDREVELIFQMASAMEMLHMASLVHDDVIDESSTRRGKPTIQIQAGVKKAVIAGDYLLTRAFSQLTRQSETIDPDIVKNSICRLCDSEIDQDSEMWDFSISEAHYVRRIAGKTASLFSLSLYLGAAAAKAPESVQFLLRRIGYGIGITFQIQDDILDYVGDSRLLGKPSGNDLRCGIATLPLIYALNADTDGKLEKFLKNRKKIQKKQAAGIIRRVNELGGLARAEEKSEFYRKRVLSDINKLGDNETSRLLLGIMSRLNKRLS